MSKLLLKNISRLYGVYKKQPSRLYGTDMKVVPCLEDSWLACEAGKVLDFGSMAEFPGITDWKGLEVIDCTGRTVMPCFADSHTHLVYAGNRVGEFSDRLQGLSYEQIASRGGGILNSAAQLRNTPENELYEQTLGRFREIMLQGTGAVEIKSGYGLDLESELKMLRVIRRLRDLNLIPVKATFLGAHAVPPEFKNNREGYVQYMLNEMLPAIAAEGLADFIDVFCEQNYFTSEDTIRILDAGAAKGLKGKVHAEQLSHSGGIQAAVASKAISVDHLEYCNEEDIRVLKSSETMATILPGAAFFLDLPRPPARKMIDAGLAVAFASDYNPGSSPSGNMKLMMSMACIQYKLSPEEAFNACTVNGAAAMDMEGRSGCLVPGGDANFIVSEEEQLAGLAYHFGHALRGEVYLNGKRFSG